MPKNNFTSTILSIVGPWIPGKSLSDVGYYHKLRLDYEKAAGQSLNKQQLDTFITQSLLQEINTFNPNTNEKAKLDLATKLALVFWGSRTFRVGWVLDGFWTVYDSCDFTSRSILDLTSRLK